MAGQGPTRVSDIVVPTIFIPYVIEQTVVRSRLIQSGIVVPDSSLDELARRGGTIINIPFFADFTGTDEVLGSGTGATDSALTPDNMDTGQDIARLHLRGKAWGSEDIAKALSGADPLAALGGMVANWWNAREQALLISSLKGVFSDNLTNDSGDLISDISVSTTAATDSHKMSAEAIVDAAAKLGDASGGIDAIAMHSVPYHRLLKQDLIEFIPDSQGKLSIPTYLGKELIVDDTCPASAGTLNTRYTTYLFGRGAIARGEGEPPVPVEVDRDSLAGVDILIHRRHFILHPRGIAFISGSVAGKAPTNTECENKANWNRVYQKKNIRIVQLITCG